MSFIATVDHDAAEGAVAELYAGDTAAFGFLPNLTRAFSLRPEVYAAWKQLSGAVRDGMDLRRYELATLAAARELRSSYCSLAHGEILARRFLSPATVAALDGDELTDAERLVVAFAAKVARDAPSVTQADVDALREVGLTDADVLDVVLTVSIRCFFSTVLDATGTAPDARFAGDLEPALRDALTVGRPIAQ